MSQEKICYDQCDGFLNGTLVMLLRSYQGWLSQPGESTNVLGYEPVPSTAALSSIHTEHLSVVHSCSLPPRKNVHNLIVAMSALSVSWEGNVFPDVP